jgi:hypothetical protein
MAIDLETVARSDIHTSSFRENRRDLSSARGVAPDSLCATNYLLNDGVFAPVVCTRPGSRGYTDRTRGWRPPRRASRGDSALLALMLVEVKRPGLHWPACTPTRLNH